MSEGKCNNQAKLKIGIGETKPTQKMFNCVTLLLSKLKHNISNFIWEFENIILLRTDVFSQFTWWNLGPPEFLPQFNIYDHVPFHSFD